MGLLAGVKGKLISILLSFVGIVLLLSGLSLFFLSGGNMTAIVLSMALLAIGAALLLRNNKKP